MWAKQLRERFREVGIRLEQGSGPVILCHELIGHMLIVSFPYGVDREAVYANLATVIEAVLSDETVAQEYPGESSRWGQVKGRPCIVLYTRRKPQAVSAGLTAS